MIHSLRTFYIFFLFVLLFPVAAWSTPSAAVAHTAESDSMLFRRIQMLNDSLEKGKIDAIIPGCERLLAEMDSTHPYIPRVYNLISTSFIYKGIYDQAIQFLRKGIAFSRDEPSTVLLQLYYNLSASYQAVGQSVQSLEALENARRIIIKSNYRLEDSWKIYVGLGIWNQKYGAEEVALRWLNQALNMMADDPYLYDRAEVYKVIGYIHYWHYRNEEALKQFQEAQKIIEYHYPEGNLLLGSVLELIARVEHDLGRKDKRDQAFAAARKLYSGLDNQHVFLAQLQIAIGWYQQLDGQYDEALLTYQKGICVLSPSFSDSLNIFSNPEPGPSLFPLIYLQLIRLKGECLERMVQTDPDSLELAFRTFQLGVEFIDYTRQNLDTDVADQIFSKYNQPIFEGLVNTCWRLEQIEHEQERLLTTLGWIEKSRSFLLAKSMFQKQSGKTIGISERLWEAEKKIRSELAILRRNLVEASSHHDTLSETSVSAQINAKKLEYDQLVAEIKRKHPDYFPIQFPGKNLSIKKVQENALREGESMVHCFSGDYHWFMFHITQSSIQLVRTDITKKKLTKLTDEFLHILKDQTYVLDSSLSQIERYKDLAYQVYQQTLESLHLKPDIKRLIVVPDGPLCKFPLELLLSDSASIVQSYRDLPYLIRHYPIQYANSAELWYDQRKMPFRRASGSMFALAQGGEGEKIFRLRDDFPLDLPGSTREIASLSRHFDGNFLSGTKVSKKAFIGGAQDCQFIHLATHAKADPVNPLQSYFIVGSGDTSSQDNRLYAHELAQLDLKADLAVLSACETGIGPYAVTEGNMSLGRSFMLAGCAALVFSMWKIEDESSAKVMDSFYGHLLQKVDKDQALRKAKLDYLATSDELTAHPFFWGAFISSGNPEPLRPGPTSWNGVYLLMALFVMMAVAGWIWANRRKTRDPLPS